MTDTDTNCWLLEAFSATAQGLQLSPTVLKRVNLKSVVGNMDEARLCRLVEPLPLLKPSEVAEQFEKVGGPRILFSEVAQAEIAEWGATRQAAQVLHELSKAVSALLRAYRRDNLINSRAVLRALPVLSMSAFIPEFEVLRRDVAIILGGNRGDVPALIGRYRRAVQSGDSDIIEAIDRQISSDPMWDRWVSGFLKEGKELARPQEPATHWEFPNSRISTENSNSICHWLFRRR